MSFLRQSVHALCQAVKHLLRRWTKPNLDAAVLNTAVMAVRAAMMSEFRRHSTTDVGRVQNQDRQIGVSAGYGDAADEWPPITTGTYTRNELQISPGPTVAHSRCHSA